MSLLDKAVKHFDSIQRNSSKIEVPEWDCEIYAKPMNMAQKSEVVAFYVQDKPGRALATKLYHMARDEDGRRLFSRDDIEGLMKRADPDVMERVGREMEIDPNIDEIEKN